MEERELKRCFCDNERGCPEAVEAAEHAVRKIFAILGVDIDKPESVEEFRDDLRFGRQMRKTFWHGTLTLTAAFATGIVWLLVEGVKSLIGKGSQ